jgi:hypothetical protein
VEQGAAWKEFFRGWPVGLDRRGVLVCTFGEQIPFDSFMPGESLLIVDRSVPDTMGARKIVVPYENIAAIKLIDVVKNKVFQPLGFDEPVTRRGLA